MRLDRQRTRIKRQERQAVWHRDRESNETMPTERGASKRRRAGRRQGRQSCLFSEGGEESHNAQKGERNRQGHEEGRREVETFLRTAPKLGGRRAGTTKSRLNGISRLENLK
ncbi:Immunoglobulin G-binding protein A [Trypanosoma vivax]|nr:Immunoglobulin G-binding protein A [Trypanosoma vivax]